MLGRSSRSWKIDGREDICELAAEPPRPRFTIFDRIRKLEPNSICVSKSFAESGKAQEVAWKESCTPLATIQGCAALRAFYNREVEWCFDSFHIGDSEGSRTQKILAFPSCVAWRWGEAGFLQRGPDASGEASWANDDRAGAAEGLGADCADTGFVRPAA